MKRVLLTIIFSGSLLEAGPLLQTPPKERVTGEQLLPRDTITRYTPTRPWHLDKWKHFCCPVRKVVTRKISSDKTIHYCYNLRDELIGIYRRDVSGNVKRSDFSSVAGCSLCGNRSIKQKSWRHNTRPGVVIPPPKKKRR